MDLLAQRYASPFLMLDEFIRLHQLHDFVIEILGVMAEEKTQEARWQFYLHKVFDKSFAEYVEMCEHPEPQSSDMTHQDIGNIINDSKKMLEGFNPSL